MVEAAERDGHCPGPRNDSWRPRGHTVWAWRLVRRGERVQWFAHPDKCRRRRFGICMRGRETSSTRSDGENGHPEIRIPGPSGKIATEIPKAFRESIPQPANPWARKGPRPRDLGPNANTTSTRGWVGVDQRHEDRAEPSCQSSARMRNRSRRIQKARCGPAYSLRITDWHGGIWLVEGIGEELSRNSLIFRAVKKPIRFRQGKFLQRAGVLRKRGSWGSSYGTLVAADCTTDGSKAAEAGRW